MHLVEQWFGDGFARLHPLLQQLHRQGGRLRGPVTVEYGRGIGRWVGARLARRLGIPAEGEGHVLEVHIRSDEQGLHWDRCFDGATRFRSLFTPVGRWPAGWWIERSGRLRLGLRVEVEHGAWHWRCVKAWLGGVRVPLWLLPKTRACKQAHGDRYRFEVSVALPVVGRVLCYRGDLLAVPA
jgi:hypothetical protein